MSRSNDRTPSDEALFALVRAERPDRGARKKTLAAVLEANRRLCAGEAAEEQALDASAADPALRGIGRRWRTAFVFAAAAVAVLAAGFVASRRLTGTRVTALAEPPSGLSRMHPAARGSDCVPARCTPVVPGDPLITDFSDLSPQGVFVDNDAFSNRKPDWWRKFYGTAWVVPASPTAGLRQSTSGEWTIQGTVNDWAGFGLWFGPCMADMSAYRGISFRIWGDAGPSGRVSVVAETDPDSTPDRCRPNVGSCDEKAYRCTAPSAKIRVPAAAARPVVLSWSDFGGGIPRAIPDPARIIQIRWDFEPAAGSGAPYPVAVHVDDVRLVR